MSGEALWKLQKNLTFVLCVHILSVHRSNGEKSCRGGRDDGSHPDAVLLKFRGSQFGRYNVARAGRGPTSLL